jgi:acetyl-CoA acyltransferase
MSAVYIIGVGMTPFGKHLETSASELAQQAATEAMADAGIEAAELDLAFYANTAQASIEGQMGIKGQHALRPIGVQGAPLFNVENACASSSSGLHLAAAHIAAGQADIAMVVGAEKLNTKDREKKFATFNQPFDFAAAKAFVDRYWDAVADIQPPEGTVIDESMRSVFMDIYSINARLHMKRFGTTWEQMAYASSKNHAHSAKNPLSQYRNEVSTEEVLAARVISWPLTLPMCAPISDGASAVVLCSEAALKRKTNARPVRLAATAARSGMDRDIADLENSALRLAAKKAYAAAGISARDIGVAEVHDAAAFSEISHVEALGLCDIGQGGPFVGSGATAFGGQVPVNLSGGLQSKGHPVAATGLGQIHELTKQLRGELENRKVPGARYAAASNGGGFMGVEDAIAVVSILGHA